MDPEKGSENTSAIAGGGSRLVRQLKMGGKKMASSAFWTRTKAFKRLAAWSFAICDRNKSGQVNKTELYAGLILVHLNLSKYVGPAACFPPGRDVVDELFEASDEDKSGGIDKNEFEQIMIILCSQITGRILTYYGILILAVPYLVTGIIGFLDFVGVDETVRTIDEEVWDKYAPNIAQKLFDWIPQSTWEDLPSSLTRTILFYLLIPITWNFIDDYLNGVARSRSAADIVPLTKSPPKKTVDRSSSEDKKAE